MFAPDHTLGGRVVVTPLDAEQWKLTEPLRYFGETDEFVVPAGYVTDFASVPRVAVWLVPKFGLYTQAAILHDYLITEGIPSGRISSRDVDGLFRRAMRELGVPPVRRWLMWTGVRWGAAFSSRRNGEWWKSAPGVLAISIPAAVAFVLPVLAVALGLVVYGAAEWIATVGSRRKTTAGSIST